MTQQKINYQKQLEKILKNIRTTLSSGQPRPTLLLHACCGPCSSYVIEYLSKYFDITIFYYNPNIYPSEEYFRRLEELKNLLPRFPAAFQNGVKLVESNYDPQDFFTAIDVKNHPEYASEPEKGQRCYNCYYFRMKKAWNYACKHNFQWFTTTLSISPFKDSEKINTIGKLLESELLLQEQAENPEQSENSSSLNLKSFQSSQNLPTTRFLTSDFKKNAGFQRSLELSREYNLYRQQYCGCVYSKQSADKARQSNCSQ